MARNTNLSFIITLTLLITALVVQPAAARDSTTQEMIEHLRFLNERDRVIAENIANANTPKYLPKDIKKQPRNDLDVKMHTTNPMHIGIGDDSNYVRTKDEIDEIKPDGNAVVLEQELLKKSNNATDFQQIVGLYNKTRNMLNSAIDMGAR